MLYQILVLSLLVHSTINTYSPPLFKIWDTRKVPYTIADNLDSEMLNNLFSAIQEIGQATCISFQAKTDYDYDYLHIEPGRSCETVVGRQGGKQVLNLNTECASNRFDIMHEFLHTLGFHHEHQKVDRDQYLEVFFDNVRQSEKEDNFYVEKLFSQKIQDLPYDYESLTHYGRFAFSDNTLPTIETKDSSKSGLIGQRQYLSNIDILKVRKYYNCEQDPILSECSALPVYPYHGTWTATQNQPGKVGHTIQYTCDSGFTLIGPTNRSCLLDGNWLAYSPICLDHVIDYCNFDSDGWCGWSRSYEGIGSGYWYLNRRGTAESQTGPNNDHTTMASNGFFAYVRSRSASRDDVAILTSPEIHTSSSASCFRFAYSMFGQTIGQLDILQIQDGVETLLFSRSGGQGPYWFTKTLGLPSNSILQIVFKLKMTGLIKGDIALDDLLVAPCSGIPPDD